MKVTRVIPSLLLFFFCVYADPLDTQARQVLEKPTLPLTFESNAGQFPSEIRYAARTATGAIALTDQGASLQVRDAQKAKSSLLNLRLVNSNGGVIPRGEEDIAGKSNYFAGSDPSNWHTDIPNFGAVRYRRVYEGVDLVFHDHEGNLEYDFVIAAGADPSVIELEFQGAQSLKLASNGDLVADVNGIQIHQRKPAFFQEIDGSRKSVEGGYILRGDNIVGFEIGPYDRSRVLTIDPILGYSTFFGGSGNQSGVTGMALDSSGNIYITGNTDSTDFPTTAGAYQRTPQSNQTGYVLKLNPAANTVLYSTYVPSAQPRGIAVDAVGNVYLTGTASGSFPVTSGAYQTTTANSFVLKLSGDGSKLVYASYFPADTASIAVDLGGNAYLVGSAGPGFPATNGVAQPIFAGGPGDGFVAKLNAAGSSLVYATFIGDIGNDAASGIAVDAFGSAYVTGHFEYCPSTCAGDWDAYVVRLDPQAQGAYYFTLLFGSGLDSGLAIAIDSTGYAYVTGTTNSQDFLVTSNAYLQQGGSGFVAKLSPFGIPLYSSYLSKSATAAGTQIAADRFGSIWVAGTTYNPLTTRAPLMTYAFDPFAAVFIPFLGQNPLSFLEQFNPNLPGDASLLMSSYIGLNSTIGGIASPRTGLPIVAGATTPDFPITPDALQPVARGTGDLFIFRLADPGPCSFSISFPAQSINGNGGPITLSVSAQTGCSWIANSSQPWLSPAGATNGSGNGSITFNAVMNPMTVPRTAVVTIGGQAVYLSQSPGAACTYTLDTTYRNIDLNGGPGVIFVTTQPGCRYSAKSSAGWLNALLVESDGSGTFNYLVTPATSPRTGTITIGNSGGGGGNTATFTVTQSSSTVTLVPYTGTVSQSTFTFTFFDPAGYQDIAGARIVFNPTLTGANSCYIWFTRPDLISLANDSGTHLTSTSPGAPAVLQNSQCSVLAGITTQSGSGNVLTFTVAVVFKTAVPINVLAYATFNTNAGLDAGFQQIGNYSVTPGTLPLRPISVSPTSGSGQVQTFNFQVFDPNGAQDISGIEMVFNKTLSGTNSCYLLFDSRNRISLASDNGISFTTANLGQQTILQNSQCAVYPGSSYQIGSGQLLNIVVLVAFKTGFAGAQNVYADVQTNAGTRTPYSQLGSWNVPATAAPLSVANVLNPSGLIDPSDALTFAYTDPKGYADIAGAQVIINPSQATTNSCVIQFTPASGAIALTADNGMGSTSATLGQPVALQNSQCIVNASSSHQFGYGNVLTLTLFVTMKIPTAQNIYATVTGSGSTAVLAQPLVWNITTPPGMTPVSVNPFTAAGAAGSVQYFTFTLADNAGANDISGSLILLYPSLQGASACYILWGHASNLVSLADDAATSFTSGTLGSTGLLQNSQCVVDPSKSFEVQTNNTVNLTLAVAFKMTLQQYSQIYSWVNVQNTAHQLSGWHLLSRYSVQ